MRPLNKKLSMFEKLNSFLINIFNYKLKINDKKYALKDKVYLKEVIIHPLTKERITYGLLVKIDKMFYPQKGTLYLADAIQYGDNKTCSSYVQEYSLKELQGMVLSIS